MKAQEMNKELLLKSPAQLQKMQAEMREQVRDSRFKVSQNQLKEVRTIRVLKKNLARVATVLSKKNKEALTNQ